MGAYCLLAANAGHTRFPTDSAGDRDMGQSLGVRGRLLLAFFSISAFALLAAGTAMVSFLSAGNALKHITEHHVPATVASQKLSRQAERIAAATPILLTVETAEEHGPASDRIAIDLARLNALLDALRSREPGSDTIALISNLVERLHSNLNTIDTMIFNNLVLIERRRELLRELGFTDISSRRLLAPGTLVLNAKLAELRTVMNTHDTDLSTQVQGLADLAVQVNTLAPVGQALVEVSSIYEMLIQAAGADTQEDLDLIVFPLRRALDTLATLMAHMDADLRARFAPNITRFWRFVDDDDGLIAARGRELRHLGLVSTLLAENVDISKQLTESVDRLVRRTERDIQAASAEARSIQRTSALILLVVVALSLVFSALIVWLYVDRILIARLTRLSDGMLAIAGGELNTPIRIGGQDEIGRMASAVEVFRETAIEVRRTNLREIQAARKRLSDAVESISEAFSLYDADDRLLLCNNHYRDNLYPDIATKIVPGATFTEILRAAVNAGLIQDAIADPEGWIKARLARHRAPREVQLQRQADGRWIQVDERRTEEGGTVAVYSDITELKQREQELSQKSIALERLSNQLGKYLPPQVYDSIFRGHREVKVASSRKKLTVFFSDIAGFTETADRLASEELTELVNQYLTEMSRIAQQHGATIDKYMGDGILIFFGDPETHGVRKDALACVEMAIAMRERLKDLVDLWRESGLEQALRVRMGIHTGYCTVGNFGSEDRLDYTIIGGAVNAASRLEARATPGEILISSETYTHVKDRIHCLEHGTIEVKGIAYPIVAYQVVDSYAHLGAERRHFHEAHPNVSLDLDLEGMTEGERQRAANILNHALDLLAGGDDGDPPDHRRQPDDHKLGRGSGS